MLEDGKGRTRAAAGGEPTGGEPTGGELAADDHGDLQQATVAPSEAEYVASLVQDAIEGQKLLVVSFFLAGSEYAFEVSDAVEVLKPRILTTVPRTPDFMKGIISVRGEMVPVLDLGSRLLLGPCRDPRSSRVLVAAVDDIKAGFIVDRLAGVEDIPKKLVKPPGRITPELPEGFLKGVIKIKKRMVGLLDIEHLLDFTVGE